MYCASCGTQISTDLSFCNRCGFSLRERSKPSTGVVTASVAASTIIAMFGLLIMFFGAITLKKAGFAQDFIGVFVLLCFLLVSCTEFFLFRNLTKFAWTKQSERPALPPPMQPELRLPQASPLGEPVPSVTENTTRTLEYSRREN